MFTSLSCVREKAFEGLLPLFLYVGALSLFICTFSGCERRSAAVPGMHDVTLHTSDGLELTATIYPTSNDQPPGLILIHMLGSDRSAWQYFAQRSSQWGYISLAYDMRGHGDSETRDGARAPTGAFDSLMDSTDWSAALADVAAAKEALLRAGADPENIAVVGASLGANLALRYALQDRQVQAVTLLSPGLTYRGLEIEETMKALSDRPVLMLAAEGDSYSASSSTRLKEIAPALAELRLYPGTAHGTELIQSSDDVAGQVLRWLNTILGSADD